MKKVAILFCLIFNSFQLFAQQAIYIAMDSLESVEFNIYEPPYRASMVYQDTLSAKNLTPEELMSSIISASNQDWVNYNTKGGSKFADQKKEEHFEKVGKRERDNNYFELLSKLEFTFYKRKMAIVKFYLHLEDKEKPVAGTAVMEKLEKGKWKVVTEPALTPISMAMMIFKPEVMGNLLSNEPENDTERKILALAYTEPGLDFNKLLQINYTTEEKEALTNPLNW
jgi:hypothetical protein